MLGLPRWAWITMGVGGLGLGLYLRTRGGEPSPPIEDSESVGEPTGTLATGSLQPPSPGISYTLGGGAGTPPPYEGKKPEYNDLIEHEQVYEPAPEIPDTAPPPEVIVQEPAPPPVHNDPISQPAPVQNDPIRAPGTPTTGIGDNVAVRPPSNQAQHEQARREIDRLQAEINGLQNHIAQLTAAIQAHPRAQQRPQWERERNQDRANIDGKRSLVVWWSARL